jgi:small subunit ribosomal protein S2
MCKEKHLSTSTSVTLKELLEAGVHFGHQTRRWNPKMKQYIFGARAGIYILDLQKTLTLFVDALQFVQDIASRGQAVLFVGTKRQAQESIAEEAKRSGMPYVNERWLGGLLTNFVTVGKSIERWKELELLASDPRHDRFTKKELARFDKERMKIENNLRGIKEMKGLPGAVFVIDTRNESIAVKEARKLKIPVIGVVDTNCDPDEVDFVIPGNDDALRAIRLFTGKIADAVIAGRSLLEAQGSDAKAHQDRGETAPRPRYAPAVPAAPAAPVAPTPAPESPAPTVA